jgi:hypothetical protein
VAETSCQNLSNSAIDAAWVMTDGTTYGNAVRLNDTLTSGFSVTCTIMAHFSYSTAGTRSFKVQINNESLNTVTWGTYLDSDVSITGNRETISVYGYPAMSSTVANVNLKNWTVDVTQIGSNPTNLGTSTVGSQTTASDASGTQFTAGPNNSTAVKVPCTGNNPATGATCSTGNEEFGVAAYIPTTGLVKACVDFGVEQGTTSTSQISDVFYIVRTNDASESVLAGSFQNTYLNSAFSTAVNQTSLVPGHGCEIINVDSVGLTDFKIQYVSNVSGVAQNGIIPVHWIITPYTQNVSVPVLTGSVISSSSGVERSERIQVDGGAAACSSSPCIIENQSGNFASSVTRTTAGEYLVNITVPFSSEPTCVINTVVFGGATSVRCEDDFSTSNGSQISINCKNTATNALSDAAFSMICQGPK